MTADEKREIVRRASNDFHNRIASDGVECQMTTENIGLHPIRNSSGELVGWSDSGEVLVTIRWRIGPGPQPGVHKTMVVT